MSDTNQHAQAKSMESTTDKEQDFFYRPQVIAWILRIFYLLSALLLLADFWVHRHIETNIEKMPGFYAVYGFVACVLLVWLATQMRKLLMRSENYYESTNAQGQDS